MKTPGGHVTEHNPNRRIRAGVFVPACLEEVHACRALERSHLHGRGARRRNALAGAAQPKERERSDLTPVSLVFLFY